MRAFLLASLVCGAAAAQPIDPDVRVHVVEKRPFTEAQRWEVSFFGSAQVNPKFTQHAGVSMEVAYHLHRNAGVLGELGVHLRRSEEHTSELQSHVNLVCR